MLQTEKWIVRRFRPEDAEELSKILSDPEVMQYIEPPFSLKKTRDFISENGLCEVPLVWALESTQTHHLMGHIIFHAYDPSHYEIGWVLDRRYWNRGIASEVTKALIQYAKEQKIPALIIECASGQDVTKHIAEKSGFTLIRRGEIYTYELWI